MNKKKRNVKKKHRKAAARARTRRKVTRAGRGSA